MTNPQAAILETERLVIRNWQERDRAIFHEINSDPQVMAFFPFTRDRRQSDARMDELRAEIARDGFGFTAIALKQSNESLGFAGLSHCTDIPAFSGGAIEIGWRLAPRHWGKGYVTEAARALLRHGFETHGFEEIVSYAVHDNHRSTAVMERLGMRHRPAFDFEDTGIPENYAHLRPHVVYVLSRKQWLAQSSA